MKKTTLIIIALAASFGFGFAFKTSLVNSQNSAPKKVVGVGGIFFKSKDPKKIKEWYKTHLGFDMGPYGTQFTWHEGPDTTKKVSLQWTAFSETTKYFEPSTKDFMINYRVENLPALVEDLKKENVTIVDTIETYPYGKFIHIMDPEGNKIELYQPNYERGKK